MNGERFFVKFIDAMPSQGPSEVEYAEILPGWVIVKWRDTPDRVRYYPSHVVLYVQTPWDEQIELPGEEGVIDEETEPTEG